MKLDFKCPLCGKVTTLDLTDEELAHLYRWRQREMLIQDALPNRTPEEREIVKTGICPDCWKQMFGGDDED